MSTLEDFFFSVSLFPSSYGSKLIAILNVAGKEGRRYSQFE
jgi:hypothetical protein